MKQISKVIKNISISCLLCFFLYTSVKAIEMVEIPQIPLQQETQLSDDKVGIQGNWMKKKEWLLKSNDIFDEIQNIIIEIQGAHKSFNEKYHVIDDEFDNFYISLSIDQGKLQEMFESIEFYLEKKKKKKTEKLTAKGTPNGETSELSQKDYLLKIEAIESEIKQNKNELEQLKLDLKSIDDLDKSIVDHIRRVDEQIAQAKNIFDKANESIEELWNIIDDKKARAIYYDLKGSTLETIKNIQVYLNEDLTRNFDTIIETARTQMNKTKESIKKLEDTGIIIKNRSKRIEQIKLEEQKQIELAKQKTAQIPTKEEIVDLKKIKKQPTFWYEKIYNYIVTTTSKIYRYIISFLGTDIKKPTKPKLTNNNQIKPIPISTNIIQPLTVPAKTTETTMPLN